MKTFVVLVVVVVVVVVACCMLNVVSLAAVTRAMFQNYTTGSRLTNLPFATSSCVCCSYSSYNYLEYVRISCNFPGPEIS